MAELTLKNIQKLYPGNVLAVKDFTLDIIDGEFLVIVGPSGCGKSTILRMIAGLEEISSGELFIGDKKMNDVAAKDRNISMVFQSYALFPHLSVFDNIAFGLKIRKTPKPEIQATVNEAAGLLGIAHLLNRKPKQLSGGERQRVAMGRAIVRNPSVFLMDEPLSNLDAKLRMQMRAELSKLHKRLQNTFVYVTHDQTEAMTLGDRIVIMNDGVIKQVGAPEEIYKRPSNTFVAGFIGSPQMNFFDTEYMGKPCIAGIRSEAIKLAKEPENGAKKALVELTELLGSELLVHLDIDGVNFVAKTYPDCGVKARDTVFASFDAGKLHYFDKDNSERIM